MSPTDIARDLIRELKSQGVIDYFDQDALSLCLENFFNDRLLIGKASHTFSLYSDWPEQGNILEKKPYFHKKLVEIIAEYFLTEDAVALSGKGEELSGTYTLSAAVAILMPRVKPENAS